MFFSGMQIYEDSRLGVSIRYAGPGDMKVDAYLYDLGLDEITSDVMSPDVEKWFQESLQHIVIVAQTSEYLDFRIDHCHPFYLPDVPSNPFCLWAATSYGDPPGTDVVFAGRWISHLTLRTDRNFINKVRCTYPENKGIAREQFFYFFNFLLEWTRVIQEFPHL